MDVSFSCLDVEFLIGAYSQPQGYGFLNSLRTLGGPCEFIALCLQHLLYEQEQVRVEHPSPERKLCRHCYACNGPSFVQGSF